MKKIFFWTAAILAVKYVVSKISLAKNFDISLKNFSIGGSLLQPEILLNFVFENKSNGIATLQDLKGVVTFANNNLVIGSVNLLQPILLQANQKSIIPIKLTGTNLSVVKIIAEYVGKKKIAIHFVGNGRADGFNFGLDIVNELI